MMRRWTRTAVLPLRPAANEREIRNGNAAPKLGEGVPALLIGRDAAFASLTSRQDEAFRHDKKPRRYAELGGASRAYLAGEILPAVVAMNWRRLCSRHSPTLRWFMREKAARGFRMCRLRGGRQHRKVNDGALVLFLAAAALSGSGRYGFAGAAQFRKFQQKHSCSKPVRLNGWMQVVIYRGVAA
jgi:hypothetical protein